MYIKRVQADHNARKALSSLALQHFKVTMQNNMEKHQGASSENHNRQAPRTQRPLRQTHPGMSAQRSSEARRPSQATLPHKAASPKRRHPGLQAKLSTDRRPPARCNKIGWPDENCSMCITDKRGSERIFCRKQCAAV